MEAGSDGAAEAAAETGTADDAEAATVEAAAAADEEAAAADDAATAFGGLPEGGNRATAGPVLAAGSVVGSVLTVGY